MVDILPLAMLVLGLTIIDVTLACAAFTRSRRRYRYAFVVLMAMEIIMAWGYLLDVNAISLSEKLFWNNLEYIGYLGAVPVSFIFVIRFIGGPWMTVRREAMLLSVPGMLWLLLVLNQYHHLFYVDSFISSNPFISYSANYGPLFYLYVGYTLSVVSSAVVFLMRHYLKTSGQHRKHVGIVTMATMIPLAATILNFIAVADIPGPFLVMAGLFVSGILLYIGAFGFEMFEIIPFAFDRVVGTIKDSVFVLDEGGQVLFLNPEASSLTGKSMEEAYHQKITEIVPGGSSLSNALALSEESAFCLELTPGNFYDASVIPIKDPGQRPVGKLVVLEDISEKKRASDLEIESSKKTDILNSITRHDIYNQLVVIDGTVDLVQSRLADEGLKNNLAIISMASRNISKQIDFLLSYQEIGAKAPKWQNISALVSLIPLPIRERGVELRVETRGAEVFADAQFEKVFYNLVDNSLNHGIGLGHIIITIKENPDFVELVYEDDGPGISAECRQHLFEVSLEGNHGAGLFLTRKILAITGMTISEEGEPGKGARFVIRVQRSHIRFT